MKVIKKNGNLSDFIPNKIKTSIENASQDSGIPLNSKDIDLIIDDVEHILVALGREKTSSYEIKAIIFDVLKKYDFNKVAESYMLYWIIKAISPLTIVI